MSESFLRTCSAALIGTEGHLLHIHAKISTGRPGFYLDGLSEQATDPTRDRMRAAIINSGLAWPQESIRVQVRPAGLPLHGAASADLAIAVALLAASSAIPTTDLDRWIMLGELGLDGKVRPVRDVHRGRVVRRRGPHRQRR
jgi:magnesium chelatase family protein